MSYYKNGLKISTDDFTIVNSIKKVVSKIDKKDLEHIPICHIHNIIQDKCKIILEDSNSFESIFKITRDILELSYIAEDQGQKMEDRLKKYRESIEGLGFKRVKKL